MWTQESEKKVVRGRGSLMSQLITSLSSESLSLSVHVTQTGSPSSLECVPLPSAGQGEKTGHGTDGIRDQGLNNEHRQRGRKMQENELISPLVPLSSFCGAGEQALLLETATATTTSSPAADRSVGLLSQQKTNDDDTRTKGNKIK